MNADAVDELHREPRFGVSQPVHALITLLLMPLSLGLALVLGGILVAGLTARRRLGLVAVGLGGLLIWVAALPGVSQALLAGLESAYPPRDAAHCDPAQAIVVLGGAVRTLTAGDVRPRLHRGSDRVWEAARLFHAGCAPRVVISAGGAVEPPLLMPEAEAIEWFLVDLGVPRSALLTEATSGNTRENAEASRALLAPLGIEHILLVTSAWHLARAVPAFQRVGFEVIPVGADYGALGQCKGLPCWLLPNAEALVTSSKAWKEYLGGWLYRLSAS